MILNSMKIRLVQMKMTEYVRDLIYGVQSFKWSKIWWRDGTCG